MPKKTHTIEIAYEPSCAAMGEETCRWLIAAGIAKPDDSIEPDAPAEPDEPAEPEEPAEPDEPTEPDEPAEQEEPAGQDAPAEQDAPAQTGETEKSGFICRRFAALRKIAMDSAIVFVSDEATGNQNWKDYVRAVAETTRLIPVGGIENVNYNDKNVLPKRIGEINFIRPDAYVRENILDSLFTDPAFYSLKNRLLLRYNCWKTSGSTSELLTDMREIRRAARIMHGRLEEEKDEHLRTQLQNILEYLSKSYQFARSVRKKNAGKWLRRGVLIASAAALMILFYKTVADFKRASLANLVSSISAQEIEPGNFAVQMAEALANPYVQPLSKKAAYTMLLEEMDKVWTQTPVGQNYKYDLNDAALPAGTRYIWTGDTGGRVLCWDTYTGSPTVKKDLSEAGIALIAVTPDGETLAAVDANGKLFTCSAGTWTDTGLVSGVSVATAEMKLAGDAILIYDGSKAEIYRGGVRETPDLGVKDAEILAADLNSEGRLTAAGSADGVFFIAVWAPGSAADVKKYPEITASAYNDADVLGSVAAVTDADGQLWKIENGAARRTGLVLPKAIEIKLVNGSTLVYHERDLGTGIYDLDEDFDYGGVLAGFSGITQLWATEEFIAAKTGFMITSAPIADVLRVTDAAAAEPRAVYDAKRCAPDKECLVKSAEITENGVIVLKITEPDTGEEIDTILDPTLTLFNNAGHISPEDAAILPERYNRYETELFLADGTPTVVGLRFEPANELNDSDGCTLIVGCADGTFAEIWVDAENGLAMPTRIHKIPSRCAVKAVIETEDGYLIEDAAGRRWQCSSCVNMVTEKGYLAAIKAKLHSGVTISMKEAVSKELWRKLDLKVYPGGDGKEWK